MIWSGSITWSRSGRRSRRQRRRDALGHVGYFAELIDEWAPEAHADERLYRLGSSVVDAIASGRPVEQLARYFEYWMLRLQGVYPASVSLPRLWRALRGRGGDAAAGARVRVPDVRPSGRRHLHVGIEAMRFLKAAGTDRTRPSRFARAVGTGGAGARNRAPAADEPAPREGAEVRSGLARDASGPVSREWSRCSN